MLNVYNNLSNSKYSGIIIIITKSHIEYINIFSSTFVSYQVMHIICIQIIDHYCNKIISAATKL